MKGNDVVPDSFNKIIKIVNGFLLVMSILLSLVYLIFKIASLIMCYALLLSFSLIIAYLVVFIQVLNTFK